MFRPEPELAPPVFRSIRSADVPVFFALAAFDEFFFGSSIVGGGGGASGAGGGGGGGGGSGAGVGGEGEPLPISQFSYVRDLMYQSLPSFSAYFSYPQRRAQESRPCRFGLSCAMQRRILAIPRARRIVA